MSSAKSNNHDEKDDIAAPLLQSFEAASAEAGDEGDKARVMKSDLISLCNTILLHAVLIALYTAIFIASFVFLQRRQGVGEDSLRKSLWSPANEHLEWEIRHLDGLNRKSIYAGKPSPQLDAAWHELLQNMNIRLFPHEIQPLNLTSLPVALADGSGFVGLLSVYHQLHCLKRIRQYLHREYYYPNISSSDLGARFDHVDHCIEMLRETATCRGDVEVIPLTWAESGAGPTLQKGVEHQCVKWDVLQEWAGERRVNLFEDELLEEPPLR